MKKQWVLILEYQILIAIFRYYINYIEPLAKLQESEIF